MALFDLQDKTIVVTGAASGIGQQSAIDMASLGATIVATDINAEGLDATVATISDNGGKAVAVAHDITSEEDWDKVVDTCKSQFGRLDVLVNNAGIMLNIPFVRCTASDFRKQQVVNVDSIFIGCKATYELMAKSAETTAGSSIINLSSIYGQVAGPMQSAYCASKGAVRMLSKSLAVELGGMNIRVNSVHPGPTNTQLGTSALDVLVEDGALPNVEAGFDGAKAMFPLGRWGEVDDVAGVIAFLASDASKFVTGSELVVDGGFTTQ